MNDAFAYGLSGNGIQCVTVALHSVPLSIIQPTSSPHQRPMQMFCILTGNNVPLLSENTNTRFPSSGSSLVVFVHISSTLFRFIGAGKNNFHWEQSEK